MGTSPPPPARPEDSSSDFYFFIVTVVVVATILLLSNVIAFSCCYRCNLRLFFGRLQPARRLFGEGGIPRAIPVRKYRKEQDQEQESDECSVCLSAFVDGEDVRHLPVCKHSFHAPCIDMWLYSHSNCPLCRAEVLMLQADPASEEGSMEGLIVVVS